MLTKEKCIEALNGIIAEYTGIDGRLLCFKEEIGIFKKLIDEHFDNPPLKFEELQVGMWVWSNEFKGWFKIHSISDKNNIELQLSLIGNLVLTVTFNENQFYRKQVEC